MLGVALAFSWSAPAVPTDRLPGFALVITAHESICGDITSMDHDFVAITEQEDQGSMRTFTERLVPVASIVSIDRVEGC